MKKQLLWCMAALSFSAASAQTYETRFARPLSDVLNDVAARFQVRLKYDVDTVGRVLPYADFRIRPYSLEETLTNVLSPFDYKFVKQSDKVYKLKPYEYARRTDADGEKMLAYLSGLYSDKSQWEQRREILLRRKPPAWDAGQTGRPAPHCKFLHLPTGWACHFHTGNRHQNERPD